MVKLPNNIYFTGAPGSMWSALARALTDADGFNTTDRNDDRIPKNPWVRAAHHGMYFGQVDGFPASLTRRDTNSAYSDPDAGCKLLKSHNWSYSLNEVKRKLEDDWIMLVCRPEQACLTWWNYQAGFEIDYPDYSAYEDNANMQAQITKQNACMLKFAYENNLTWSYFTLDWIKETFGVTAALPTYAPVLESIKADVLVTVYKP